MPRGQFLSSLLLGNQVSAEGLRQKVHALEHCFLLEKAYTMEDSQPSLLRSQKATESGH